MAGEVLRLDNNNQKNAVNIEVFSREVFEPLGGVDNFSSLQWVEKPSAAGWFELWCPLETNVDMLRETNIIWIGGESAMSIETIKKELSEERGLELQLRGKTLEYYTDYRIVWDMTTKTGPVSDVMKNLVNLNIINPTNIRRKLNSILIDVTGAAVGDVISYQNTGGNLHDVLAALAESYDLCWKMVFNPFDKIITFKIWRGVDRTDKNTFGNDAVIFDSDMEDILKSAYFKSLIDYRNVALVAGEDSGSDRVRVTINDNIYNGYDRRELYVDARDLQSENENGDPIPAADYKNMLISRGENKLNDKKIVETFEATLKIFGNVQYKYGIDYNNGDWVTIQDRELGVVVNAKVTEVQKIYDNNGYSLVVSFGFTQPTLTYLVKQAGAIL